MNLFQWRNAIASKSGPKEPTTRHVLLTISLHMNCDGESCFPSVNTLAEETGRTKKSVIVHIEKAEKAGWIKKEIRGFSGQGWRRHKYRPNLPADVVKQLHHVDEKGGVVITPRQEKGGVISDQGGVIDDQKVVSPLHPSSSSSTSNNSSKDIGAKKSPRPPKTSKTLPPENIVFSKKHVELAKSFNLDLTDHWERYRDHWLSKGGKLADHNRAFNNWLKKSNDFNQTKGRDNGKNFATDNGERGKNPRKPDEYDHLVQELPTGWQD